MYIMLGSRPDICFAISYFSQFQDCATDTHFNHLIRVLKYLNIAKDFILTYDRSKSNVALEIYSDADWANCVETRRSISGGCGLVFGNLVSWFSRKQSSVTLSSTESELISLCEGVKEEIWLKRLLADLGVTVMNNCIIYEDNQSVLKLIKMSNWTSKRSKHVDMQYRFIVEKFVNRDFIFKYVMSNQQLADILTKSLTRVNFERLVKLLNLI